MEFLKEILGEELYSQVEAKLKGNDKVKLANLASGEYVSKAKYDDKVSELTKANQTIITLQETAEKYKGVDVEGLKKQIKEEQTRYATDTAKLMDDIKKRDAVDSWLDAHPTKHRQLIRSQFDFSKLSIENEKVSGIDEIGNGLLESYKDLFIVEDHDDKGGQGGAGGMGHGGNPQEKDPGKMSMEEYVAWRKGK